MVMAGSFLSLGRVLANSSSSIAATSLYIRSKVNASTHPESPSAVRSVSSGWGQTEEYVILTEWRFNFGRQPFYYLSAVFDEPLEMIYRVSHTLDFNEIIANLPGFFPMTRPFFARQVIILDS